jgi:MFS family permease
MLTLLPSVATVSLNVVAVAYVLDVMHQDATVYGLSDMCYGVGALVSGFLGGVLVLRFGRWSALTACLLFPLAVYLVFVTGPTRVPLVLVLAALAGFGSSAFRVIAQSVLLAIVPGAVMGRATAVFGLSSTLVQVGVALLVGLVMEAWGAQAGFAVLAGVIGICLAGVLTVVPGVRRLAEVA